MQNIYIYAITRTAFTSQPRNSPRTSLSDDPPPYSHIYSIEVLENCPPPTYDQAIKIDC